MRKRNPKRASWYLRLITSFTPIERAAIRAFLGEVAEGTPATRVVLSDHSRRAIDRYLENVIAHTPIDQQPPLVGLRNAVMRPPDTIQ